MGKKNKRKNKRSKSVEGSASNNHGVSASNDEKKEASFGNVSRDENESSREASTSTGGKRSHSVHEEGGQHSKSKKKRKRTPEVPGPPVVGTDDKGKNWPS
jgi:hypothetical protein